MVGAGGNSDYLMGMELPFGVMKMSWKWTGVTVAQHRECTKATNCSLRWPTANFMLGDFYLN